MKTPDISIIVSVYNAEAHLTQCVESILAQTHANLELILVNDGSKDGSGDLCDKFAASDPRVVAIHTENHGQTHARTTGLKKSRGEYIHLVDADDWLVPNMEELMFATARKHNADIVTCNATFHYAKHSVPVKQYVPTGVFDKERLMAELYPKMLYSGRFFFFGIYAAMWNKLFRRDSITPNILAVDESIKIGEDGVATYGAFLDAKKVVVLPDHLYQYRDNNDSITRTYCKEQFDSALTLINALRKLNDKKSVYDLSSQIDYYFMYNVRSIFLEEFYYRHKKKFSARHTYLRRIATHPDVVATAQRIQLDGAFTPEQLAFFAALRSGNFNKLIITTMKQAYTSRAKLLVKKRLGRY